MPKYSKGAWWTKNEDSMAQQVSQPGEMLKYFTTYTIYT